MEVVDTESLADFSVSVLYKLKWSLTDECLLVLVHAHSLIIVPSISLTMTPPKGGWGFLMSPPCLESQAVSLIPLFYISSLVLLPSPVALSVLSFSAFGLFS